MIRRFLFLLSIVFSSISGGCQEQKEVKNSSYSVSTDELIKMNRDIVNKDGVVIEKYIADNKLVMKKTNTGLWYRIDKVGTGTLAKVGQTVSIVYTIKLLDGTLCYKSDSLGVKVFRLGQGGVESGLEEGLLLLKTGGKATFIMPPHLAHGLTGDNDKIPYRSILIYEAEIIGLR